MVHITHDQIDKRETRGRRCDKSALAHTGIFGKASTRATKYRVPPPTSDRE